MTLELCSQSLGNKMNCTGRESGGRELSLKARHAVFWDSIRQRCQKRLRSYVPDSTTLLSMVSLNIYLRISLRNLWIEFMCPMEVDNRFPKIGESGCPRSLCLYPLWPCWGLALSAKFCHAPWLQPCVWEIKTKVHKNHMQILSFDEF